MLLYKLFLVCQKATDLTHQITTDILFHETYRVDNTHQNHVELDNINLHI